MILLECPNCGPRAVSEFRFGEVHNPRPSNVSEVSDARWTEYLYIRSNSFGVQAEWWYHAYGCGVWFLAERHTGTNQVMTTRRPPRGGAV